MGINFILMFIFLTGQCIGYTLRRDIGNIRHYCNKICTGCGGKPALEKDVCICDFKEETDKTRACINGHKSKFDFLGIKYDVRHKIKKRSIYNPKQPYLLNAESTGGFSTGGFQKEGYRYLIKRSYIIPEPFSLQGRITETPIHFEYSRIFPRIILKEQSRENYESPRQTPKNSRLTQFSANNFLPIIPSYPTIEEGDFKIQLPRSNDNYPDIHCGYFKDIPEFRDYNSKNAGGDDNGINCDYEDVTEECDCGIDYESTENLGGKGFELVISDGFEFGDNGKEGHGWERVIYDADYQDLLSELIIPKLEYV